MTPSRLNRVLAVPFIIGLLMAGLAAHSNASPAISTLGAGQTAQRDTPIFPFAERKQRANEIARMAFRGWKHLKKRYGNDGPTNSENIDATFVWDDDGCSLPETGATAPVRAAYNRLFNQACERHDFGYRNLGNGYFDEPVRALESNNQRKLEVDDMFYADMRATCNGTKMSKDRRRECLVAASAYYQGVRRAPQAETAWHKGECHDGNLCLFADAGWEGKRVMLKSSAVDLDTVDLNDKAHSFQNLSNVIWFVYEDKNYKGDRICIPVDKIYFDLEEVGYEDTLSSAKRTGSSGNCP